MSRAACLLREISDRTSRYVLPGGAGAIVSSLIWQGDVLILLEHLCRDANCNTT